MPRVHAPELTGAGGWIGGGPLTLAALRGRIVLIDFWTSACVNCTRVVEELRELERRYADVLSVVGVHSPKFARERDHEAVRAAVARLRIEHPVLDDSELRTWDEYAVRAWPTLVLVDPTGREAMRVSGEGHAARLATEIESLAAEARAAGTLRDGVLDLHAEEPAGTSELCFPGSLRASPDATRLAVADTGNDRVLVTTLGGDVLAEHTGIYAPQGVRWEDDGALLVCEEPAGRVWRIDAGGRRTVLVDGLASPRDVVRWHGHLTVAESGRHRIRVVDAAGEAQVVAGTGQEGLIDGPALEAQLAQPSSLAVTAAGELAWVDAEASALRVLDRPAGVVRTLVGAGLFSWGDADGDRGSARMQHPLGVAAAGDGTLYVADSFNGLVRVFRGAHLWTVPTEGFADPGGLDVLPDGRVAVADTGNHRIVVLDPADGSAAAAAASDAEVIVLPEGGTLEVTLGITLGDDVLDFAEGAPVKVSASATEPSLLAGETSFARESLPASVVLELGRGSGRIVVELRAATCTDSVCRLRRTRRAYDVILTS